MKLVHCFVSRKKKRIREQKKKLRERLAGKLADASGDTGATEEDLFALRNIKNKQVHNILIKH